MSNYFEDCFTRYGPRTCVMVEYAKARFEAKYLDTKQHFFIERHQFFEFIPKMLMARYTVVIVEQYVHSKEITAVHLPMQAHLTTPPIIQ